MSKKILRTLAVAAACLFFGCKGSPPDTIRAGFLSPPDEARPGVYWYFMDGNTSREAMTADLESMKEAGIGYALFLEVNVGIPRGKVDFLSPEWQDLFAHAVREAERLGIRIILGSGPGWAGSGGPWVRPADSMTHLVASSAEAVGPGAFAGTLPVPAPRTPFFGEESLTPALKAERDAWYEDTAVLAFPTPAVPAAIPLVDEKALYYRAPYTSQPGVLPFLAAPASFPEVPGSAVDKRRIVDLTGRLGPAGRLRWDVPPGRWTVLRFGRRNNGAVTRPAPMPGLGFECDKFERAAFDAHFEAYVGKLLKKVGPRQPELRGGWSMIHIDSWEMGAQNWSPGFRGEFTRRRGYDPLRFLPAYTGRVVGSREESERFLWDLRRTSSELIVENHALRFKELGQRSGFTLSIEPYDMNPAADLDLGGVADVPMGEFWSDGYGFNSAFSAIEAASIAHVAGAPVVAAESFTADDSEAWKKYPGDMKDQGDWAFGVGLNRLVYHTFAHKGLGESYRPGMTMGPYGVHWDRGQTWWPMVPAYHLYISRCQYLLSQGRPVADILYLTPEGAPQVFRAPASALEGTAVLPDKRGFAFDGCSPVALMKGASVEKGRIVFPGGASYRLLVLPAVETMTPELLAKVESLAAAGAAVVGRPPLKSPSLENFPECDARVAALAENLWGGRHVPSGPVRQAHGLGSIFWGGELTPPVSGDPATAVLYPDYAATAAVLGELGERPDFTASGGIRYTHRSLPGREIYFISNRTAGTVEDVCLFRDGTENGELWDAVTGETRPLRGLGRVACGISLPVRLEAHQSFFIVFGTNAPGGGQRPAAAAARTGEAAVALDAPGDSAGGDFPVRETLVSLAGPWTVSFDPAWGGPASVVFDRLDDWSMRPEDRIRHYSGIATYSKTFDLPETPGPSGSGDLYIDLGEVKNMARVRLNGRDLGVVWTAPWRVKITGALEKKDNRLEIEVANLWTNRLIGDESEPWDGVERGEWPAWLLEGRPRPTRRFTFTTHRFYKAGDPLAASGLLGPVSILR
jgi:hypothetical protein